ncbi:response regulator transcription factor [Paenibacillus sp. y28]|uniref:response regulator transcription factor n=1 Tax=Paenibacillus sp. y28 TaxID=3129110 RepID=UPI003019FCFD
MHFLLVEDEPKIREVLTAYIKNEGWTVDCTASGTEALEWFREREYQLVILDLMLEGLPGEEVCANIRGTSLVPLMMITAKSREADTIAGLRLGADDYISKPFRVKEVIARIHALLRRAGQKERPDRPDAVPRLSFDQGRLVLMPDAGTVLVDGRQANLTATELKLLSVLVSRPGRLFSRNDLTYQVLGYTFQGDSRSIDTHLKNLRKKIERDPREPRYILTLVGAGYKFAASSDERDA